MYDSIRITSNCGSSSVSVATVLVVFPDAKIQVSRCCENFEQVSKNAWNYMYMYNN